VSPILKMKAAYVSATLATVLASHDSVAGAGESYYEAPQRLVKFADLDVTRTPGAASLYARITTAAQDVCQTPFNSRDQVLTSVARKCQQRAIERAVTDVNLPVLTSYHLMKTKSGGACK
jgi:UrcA family protein